MFWGSRGKQVTDEEIDFYQIRFQTGICTFKIEIKNEDFKESGVCPLNSSEVAATTFEYNLREKTVQFLLMAN